MLKNKPVFSIIVAVQGNTVHLLPFTLDSIISQSFEPYEIIIIDGQTKEHSLHVFNAYRSHISRIYSALDRNLFAMFNKGISLAQGEYLHFLVPGEFYLSRQAFSFMWEFILTQSSPDLVYTGSIVRHSFSPPQTLFQQISEETLKGAKIPLSLTSYWFRKEALLTLGKFNTRYRYQGGFDLVCRFYNAISLRKAFLRRILTDYEYRLSPPKVILRQLLEILFTIFCYFGFSKAVLWWLAQNHFRFIQWGIKCIKGAFWVRP